MITPEQLANVGNNELMEVFINSTVERDLRIIEVQIQINIAKKLDGIESAISELAHNLSR